MPPLSLPQRQSHLTAIHTHIDALLEDGFRDQPQMIDHLFEMRATVMYWQNKLEQHHLAVQGEKQC